MSKKIDKNNAVIPESCKFCPFAAYLKANKNFWCSYDGVHNLGEDLPEQIPQWCKFARQ